MRFLGSHERPANEPQSVYRYALIVRWAHWTNVICLIVLVMSGLQIFNAHPALYWGEDSDFDRPFAVLGPFPGWLTIPSFQDLATGRVWHFFFGWLFVINGLVYAVHSTGSGRLRDDLTPAREDWRLIGSVVRDHFTLRFPRGPDAARYNVIQRLVYLGVAFVFAPIIILTGLTMSPAVNSAVPWLLDVFGGRQSARTIHFIIAALLVAFVLLHITLVAVSGFLNNLRSMITGWFSIAR
jgi:thiosulfate reductase cytochrome b subunit